jgi:trehalose 6-phosphate synthase
MVHDYHLYTLPGADPPRAPGRVPAPLRPHPLEPVGRLAGAALDDPRGDLRGILANDIIGFHTRSYRATSCSAAEDLLGSRSTSSAGSCSSASARCGCAPTRCRSTTRQAVDRAERARARVRGGAAAPPARHLILRVDRADLSKNVLRGFSAFDLFLEQHPEFPSG